MISPQRVNQRRVQVSRSYPRPAPVGGLNARDSLADMPEQDGILLDNWFCQPDFVEVRRGHASHATGMTNPVRALFSWHGPASAKFFAATSSSIFDVTSAGAVGAAVVSGMTSGDWQHTMMATSGGNFLIICNGADDVRNYNGTTWATTPAITGVTPSSLIGIANHKRRLWFIEKDTLSAWYLAVDAIGGAATELDLGSLFPRGGKLQAIGTLSVDGGSGPDDYLCFITSRGEIAMYAGTDPASASTWSIVGVFLASPPIGRRCLEKAGGDLSLITEGGVVSLSAMLALDRAAEQKAAITAKINRLFATDSRDYRTNFGWQFLSYPRSNMVLINVPATENAEQRQYVMNSLTGAWSRFTGMNGGCWALFNDDLYFGGNAGVVYKADTSYQDNGAGITADLKSAFSNLGSATTYKAFRLARYYIETDGSPGVLAELNVDFEDMAPIQTPIAVASPSSPWGTALWGISVWGGATQIKKDLQGGLGGGHSVALRMRIVTNGAFVRFYGFHVIAESGAVM